MVKKSKNTWDIYADVSTNLYYANHAFYNRSFKKYEVHEIMIYYKKALEIEEYINNRLLARYHDENLFVRVSFNKALDGKDEESVLYICKRV